MHGDPKGAGAQGTQVNWWRFHVSAVSAVLSSGNMPGDLGHADLWNLRPFTVLTQGVTSEYRYKEKFDNFFNQVTINIEPVHFIERCIPNKIPNTYAIWSLNS